MDYEEFREKYDKLVTYDDADKLIDEMDMEQIIQLARCLDIVNHYTGLDMKQVAFMYALKRKIVRDK